MSADVSELLGSTPLRPRTWRISFLDSDRPGTARLITIALRAVQVKAGQTLAIWARVGRWKTDWAVLFRKGSLVFMRTLLALMIMGFMISTAQADTRPIKLTASTFQDWKGSLVPITLNDGSQLNEYVAKTMSGSVEGASFGVSFLPRFRCAPVISVSVAAVSGIDLDTTVNSVQLKVDSNTTEFPVLVDDDEDGVRFTYNADENANQELLKVLDVSSRVSLVVPGKASAEDSASGNGTEANVASVETTATQIEFSLLGSKLSTQATRDHCQSHIPIPFEI